MVIPADAATREQLVWEALATIPDPEIPAISLVDLGVIGDVRVADDGALARVELLPTFVGPGRLTLTWPGLPPAKRSMTLSERRWSLPAR